MSEQSTATGSVRRVAGRLLSRREIKIATVIAAGGALGAGARYGLQLAFENPHPGIPWATVTANVVGCLAIGVLMVVIERVLSGQVLVRPFVGVGLLGGFTTFSAYAMESVDLMAERPVLAMANLAATPVLALAAVIVGTVATELTLRALARAR